MKKRSKAVELAKTDNRSASTKLTRRKSDRNSTIKIGRTIAEKRERPETANERSAASRKNKKKKKIRVFFTLFWFVALGMVLVFLGYMITNNISTPINDTSKADDDYAPTIEVIDEDTNATNGKITNNMSSFIGQLEQDFRDLGYTPTKAIIPTNTVREVDFYLEGYNGYIKTNIDRGSAVSAEDADRLMRYLKSQGISDFTYLDVRIEYKAYWK